MDVLLLAFALPVATILLAIVLQKILRSPLLVAATFFAVYLIVTYAAFDSSFLVFAILYTILAYVTAVLTRLICNIIRRFNLCNNENCACGNTNGIGLANTNANVSNASWTCTTRNLATTNGNQISATPIANNGEDPVIILTNTNGIMNANNNNARNGRTCCNCGRR